MAKKIIYTVCTVNYLAQAKSLGDSIISTNSDYQLVIGLVDKIDNRFDAASFSPYILLEVEQIGVPVFADMCRRYSPLELCCAVKPWFALFIFEHYNADQVIYFDTDILLFGLLTNLENEMTAHSVLLTPHVLSTLPEDGKRPGMTNLLRTGIYNAGFFAVKNDVAGNNFLTWWKEILVNNCYEDGKRGLASDQSWLNFVPVFFDNVFVVKHPGYNAAYWNLHERTISKSNNEFIVNDKPLLFFHFSGYSIDSPNEISRHQDRVSMDDNAAIKELFGLYQATLLRNKHSQMLKLNCYYAKSKTLLKKLGLKK